MNQGLRQTHGQTPARRRLGIVVILVLFALSTLRSAFTLWDVITGVMHDSKP